MDFPANLKRFREDAGLTQAQLADVCGYSGQSTIGNYERGTREPKLSELHKIASAVGKPIASLLGMESREDESQPLRLDPEIVGEVIQEMRGLNAEGATFDIDSVKAFVEAYTVGVHGKPALHHAMKMTRLSRPRGSHIERPKKKRDT